ncbi:MAG: substrate-binding periplasmic protein [Bacteroidota bacterium]
MRAILSLLGAFIFSASLAQKYTGDSWAKVKSAGSGTLTVFYYEQPGLIYKDGGKMKGMCADLLTEFTNFVQTKYGKKVTINYAGAEPVFTEFLLAAQNNKDVLGVTNVNINEERKKLMKFTPYFLTNPVVLLTHKDAPTLTGFTDIKDKLAGYTAEVIGGSTHVKHIEKIKKENWPGLKISIGPSGPEILKKMESNPKLFTILDFTEYIDATRKGLPVKKQNLDFGAAEELGFIMNKQTDWDEPWKEFLTPDYRKSVKYRKMIADNLGASFLAIVK